jgi:hypothetical protein
VYHPSVSLFILFGVAFFFTLAVLLVLRITRRGHDSDRAGKRKRWESHLVATIAGVDLLFPVIFLLALIYQSQPVIEFDACIPTLLAAVLGLPILTSLLSHLLPVVVLRTWVAGLWSLYRRIAYSLFAVFPLAFIPFLQ